MNWPGLYQGVVLSTADPQNGGRVRLQVPQVSGSAPTAWAPAAQQGSALPAVGSLVWVMYQGGDPSYPVYIPPVAPTPLWQVDAAPVLGGMTLGNGSISSRYLVDGYTVAWSVQILWGSTTTASPSAAITITPPVAPDPGSGGRWLGDVLINPAGGAAWKPGGAWLIVPSTTASIEAIRVSDVAYQPFSVAGITMASGGWVSMNMRYDRAIS